MRAADKSRAVPAILLGGLIAGTLDISYACIFSYIRRGASPVRVLQSVASGALGRISFDGGARTAALGLVFHFLIATIAAAVYYLASRPLRFLVTWAYIFGPQTVWVYLVPYCDEFYCHPAFGNRNQAGPATSRAHLRTAYPHVRHRPADRPDNAPIFKVTTDGNERSHFGNRATAVALVA